MRIAIVNDMLMAVEAMRRIIIAHGGHQVVWVARDGEEAINQCERDRPDLILMDLVMPRLDGIEATRLITSSADGSKRLGSARRPRACSGNPSTCTSSKRRLQCAKSDSAVGAIGRDRQAGFAIGARAAAGSS